MKCRVLIVHNSYRIRGGEDAVAEDELALLRAKGHAVELYRRCNDDIPGLSRRSLALQSLWSSQTSSEIGALIGRFRPHVMHVHNTFPLVSPSLYWSAAKAGVPVVQTLHNFRLLCPQAMFLRNGRICEECVGTLPWRALYHRCYRHSLAQSSVLSAMIALHRGMGTYGRKITRYIALNQFCRDKFIEGGLPADRLRIKPNFLQRDAQPQWHDRRGALFVGRLSAEKGLATLAGAVSRLDTFSVSVIGHGEMEHQVRADFGSAFLGYQSPESILDAMGKAAYLVLPSLWYENFPRTVVEAFAMGLPVIASRIGSLPEIVEDGRTGLLFEVGNPADLAEKMTWANAHPEKMLEMGRAAYAEFRDKYTAERNYEILLDIYRDAIACHRNEQRAFG